MLLVKRELDRHFSQLQITEISDRLFGEALNRGGCDSPPVNLQVSLNSHLAPFLRTGKMPVPQKINFFVEQAGKPVHKRLIENGARYENLLRSDAPYITRTTQYSSDAAASLG